MKDYKCDSIRNVALIGHGGTGKTTFLEAALLATGVINRLGKVEDGNTVSDWDKMEIAKRYSINQSVVPVEYKNCKINFVDTPGFFDFVGEVDSALRAVEAAVIVVDASAGVQVGTDKSWEACKKFGVPIFFLMNKTDKDNVDIDQAVSDLKTKFGSSVVTLDDRDALNEAIAETDEALLEKFFDGGEFTDEEFKTGLSKGIASGDIVPLIMCSAITGEGVKEALDIFVDLVPKPSMHADYPAFDGSDNEITVKTDPNGPFAAFVFKTIADPQIGKISFLKIISGKLQGGHEVFIPNKERNEKLGTVFFMRGKSRIEATNAEAGDIIAAAKLADAMTGDTLCEKSNIIRFPGIDFPKPALYIAIEAKAKGDEDKLSTGLHRLMEEDPSFVLERNNETHQSLLGGQGEMQLNNIISKLKDKFGVEVEKVPQKIAYRETIKGTSDVQGKHKKQSGGAGQYGDVHIRFSPSEEEFEFVESLFGGSIPKNYVPAVEKGLRESLEKGPLAGCKVVNVKADLYDGSYHEVDSNEVSFKIAAALAFKKGIKEASPCLLEPIMHLEIIVPDEFMGDIMGDMNKRRGRILGSEPMDGNKQKVFAEAPQAELFDYAVKMRSMTQARGSFTMEFERYDPVPPNVAEKIIAAYDAEQAEN
ncbi:MAG: elongation factor G [Eubacteriaceae bacterium]|jgi:elongation factor G|nr:elongation factor G [Eubacteriaceae bacterium]